MIRREAVSRLSALLCGGGWREAPPRVLLAALVVLTLLAPLAQARNSPAWLVLVVDRSGSISDEELSLQRAAYVSILRDPTMAEAFARTKVAIVEFDTTAEIVVDWTGATEASFLYAAYNPVAPRGGTSIGRGLEAALRLLEGRAGERIVDISGDGRDNRDQILLANVRAAALRGGVEINGLVFEGRSNARVTEYYKEKVVTGFTIGIGSMDDFLDALRQKLQRELNLAFLPAR